MSTLPPHRFYYLHNFQRALDWLGQRYGDLLSAQELQFMTRFAQLPQASQALLVRMIMRRGPWFRADKLVYEEIPALADAAQPLRQEGWIDDAQPMTAAELFGLHTKPELLQILRDFPGSPVTSSGTSPAISFTISPSLRKSEMLALVQSAQQGDRAYAQWHPQAAEPVWRLMVGELCERFRLMFFGNLYQDWSEFVLADLGVFRYESVAFDAGSRAFQQRCDVDVYLALSACRQALDEGADVAALGESLAQYQSANPWLEKRRAKLLLQLGQACERTQNWTLAQSLYARSNYPGARHRQIRVLERLEQFNQALALAELVQSAPESEEEAQRIARMLPRLRRSTGAGAAQEKRRRAAALAPAVAGLRSDVTLAVPAEPMAVEYALREHWQSEQAPVFYVENALINSLFGLLCWPAIFAPLPGAFFHPFQSGPADLSAPDFVPRRQALFDACLEALADGSYRRVIAQRFAEKQGLQSPFVFWGALSEELLTLALDCIPAAHLQLFFARLLRDVKGNRTGFPDLVRFWPAREPEQPRYELVEVKAPGDKLQDNQIRWLAYCTDHGLPVSVCHVQWGNGPPAEGA
ncbi:MAG: VRR-NUC domain-containing protein [Comamonas sp.]